MTKNPKKQKMIEIKGENGLKDVVIDYIIDRYETDSEIKGFFEDLIRYGCVSGMVTTLIYYQDTNKFYEIHEDDIEDLLDEYKKKLGYNNRFELISFMEGSENVRNITQEKNLLAWFGFQETAYNIYREVFEDK